MQAQQEAGSGDGTTVGCVRSIDPSPSFPTTESPGSDGLKPWDHIFTTIRHWAKNPLKTAVPPEACHETMFERCVCQMPACKVLTQPQNPSVFLPNVGSLKKYKPMI
jgi:hypothetical protein